MYYDVIMSGFGGQGIQLISQILVVAAIEKGLNVTYRPSYGVEKRGGRTDVTVVISDVSYLFLRKIHNRRKTPRKNGGG